MGQLSELREKLEAERHDLINRLKEVEAHLAAIEKAYGPIRPQNTILQVDDAEHVLTSSVVKSELAPDQKNRLQGLSGQAEKDPSKAFAE